MRLDARFYIPTCTFTIHHYDLRSKKQIPSKCHDALAPFELNVLLFNLRDLLSSTPSGSTLSLFLQPNYVEHEHGAAIPGRAKYFCNLINFRGLPFLHEWHFLSLNRPLSLYCQSYDQNTTDPLHPLSFFLTFFPFFQFLFSQYPPKV